MSHPSIDELSNNFQIAHFTDVMKEILGESSMLDSRADSKVPLVFAISSKMSSTPTQLCLFRNYNYNGGEMPDKFVVDPDIARKNLNLPLEKYNDMDLINSNSINVNMTNSNDSKNEKAMTSFRPGEGSRHPGEYYQKYNLSLFVIIKMSKICHHVSIIFFKDHFGYHKELLFVHQLLHLHFSNRELF